MCAKKIIYTFAKKDPLQYKSSLFSYHTLIPRTLNAYLALPTSNAVLVK